MNDQSVSASHGDQLDTTDPEVLTQPDVAETDTSAGVDDPGDVISAFGPPSAPVDEPDDFTEPAGDNISDISDISDTSDISESIDLDVIERDLTDVQTALERLDDGSYWTDEVTGAAIPDDVLASFPLTRTVAGNAVT